MLPTLDLAARSCAVASDIKLAAAAAIQGKRMSLWGVLVLSLVQAVTSKTDERGFFKARCGNAHDGVGISIPEVSFIDVRHRTISFLFIAGNVDIFCRSCSAERHVACLVSDDRIASSALASTLRRVGRCWDFLRALPHRVRLVGGRNAPVASMSVGPVSPARRDG